MSPPECEWGWFSLTEQRAWNCMVLEFLFCRRARLVSSDSQMDTQASRGLQRPYLTLILKPRFRGFQSLGEFREYFSFLLQEQSVGRVFHRYLKQPKSHLSRLPVCHDMNTIFHDSPKSNCYDFL